MKKLVLVPTILATTFLLFVFLLPATAAGVLRTVAPAFHAVAPSTVSAAGGSRTVTQSNGVGPVATTRQGSTQKTGQSSSSTSLSAMSSSGHSQSTGDHENCGRFGNHSHGGKHDNQCPNRPYPVPPNR